MAGLYVEGATRNRATATLEQLGTPMYRAAYERGMNLSQLLEEEDPSDEYPGEHLDAYERVLHVAGIRTYSQPGEGIWASEFGAFNEERNHALVPEWFARVWRRVVNGNYSDIQRVDGQRIVYGSDDFPAGSWARPYADAAGVRAKLLAPPVPIAALVALTSPIDGDTYRMFYLTEPTGNEYRMVRVGQMAEIPRAKLTGSEHIIRLYKYGRALELSYEAIRRRRVDWVAFHIARLAIQSETDKVATILDVLLNGDGNSATAATNHNLTTLDAAASAGTLTLKGWLAYKFKFYPYVLDVILIQEAVGLQLALLTTGNANNQLASLAGFGSLRPLTGMLDSVVGYGITADAPALKIMGIDSRSTIERVVEIGSNINETDRWITRQTNVMTMTEVEGYAVLDANGSRSLNVNA